MTTRADPDLNGRSVFDGINGRDVLGARTNAQGTVVVTKRGWTWFQRSRKPAATRRPDGSALIGTAAALLLALGLGLLLVSLAAQYRYVLAERHQSAASMIEAAALDVGMMIFSLLALGLARGGQSAKVERALIVACAAGSALMNYAAADVSSPRSVLAYCLPPVFLAVVVDRVVVTVRRHVLGMRDGRSPWTAAGKVALYALRLVIAPVSTLGGGRRLLLAATPLPVTAVSAPRTPMPRPARQRVAPGRDGTTKTARFLQLVQKQHGPLAAIPLDQVSQIATAIAPEAALHPASARTALLGAVRSALPAGKGDAR
jgi:hypothetical protein